LNKHSVQKHVFSNVTLLLGHQLLSLLLRVGVPFFAPSGVARHAQDRKREGGTLRNLGKCHQKMDDHTKAIQVLGQALAIAKELKDGPGSALLEAMIQGSKDVLTRPAAANGGAEVKKIDDEDAFNAFVLNSTTGRLVCVDYSATWCPPSRQMEPVLGRLAEEFPDVDFVRVDEVHTLCACCL
jgi:thiol-disulfide isomerase/thioredoxin